MPSVAVPSNSKGWSARRIWSSWSIRASSSSRLMSIASIRTLRLLMPLSALTATLTQAVAIFTNNWLYTMELMPNKGYERFKMPPEMEYLRKYTTSGMLELCQNEPPIMEMRCRYIDYFSQEEYIPDQNDSTMAIPYSMKRALAYIMASAAILLLGEAIYLCRKLCGHRQIYTFLSGIAFILAGLTILASLVVYISTFKGEVSNKLRPLSEFQDALFHYRYGFSFLMLVASLILCEVSGTLAIFLYIRQKQFKIMIDAEREEVLKKNILSLIAPDIKVVNGDSNPVNTTITTTQPMLRIICEDENGVPVASASYAAATTSPVDHNFLSAEFGLDPSLYFCGRHGSRGRRNSRSNESFLGSSQGSASESRSRKNSFTSMQDDTSQQPSPLVAENSKPKTGCDKVCDPAPGAHSIVGNNSPPDREQANLSAAVLHELHVPSLAQLQREPVFTAVEPPISQSSRSIKKTRFQYGITKSESHEMSLPYLLPMSSSGLRLDEKVTAVATTTTPASSNNSSDKPRNRLTKQTSLNINPNRSTFV